MKKLCACLGFALLFKLNLLATVQTIAVLPFANLSKNHAVRWISESIPELLQDFLRWPNLNVLGREERLIAFDRIGIPYSNVLSKASLIKIGQELDSSLLILGDFNCDGKKLQTSASILDLHKNTLSVALREEGDLVDLQAIGSRLAWRILKILDPSFPLNCDSFVARFPAIPNIALEYYVRGLIESDQTKQIQLFRQADRAYPSYSKAIFQLGKIYYQEKDYSTSSLWLQRLIKLDKEFPAGRFLLGLDYLHLKNYEKAEIEFQQLGQMVPLNEVHNNLGIALSFRGLRDNATNAFQKALENDPSGTDCLFNLAYHFWKTGSFAEAAKNLKEVIHRDEGDAEAHYLLYKCLQALGRPAEANASWTLAKQFDPKVETWETRKQIPDLFRVQSSFDEASFRQLQLEIQAVQDSKKGAAPRNEKIADYLDQAQKYFESSQLEYAEHTLAQAIQIAPESSEARLMMGRVLEGKGEKLRAISEYRTSVWLKESVKGRVLLSRLYLSLDRQKEAQAEARHALELEPGDHEAQEILAKLNSTREVGKQTAPQGLAK